MALDTPGAHARDELGFFETLRARPIEAAWASDSGFAIGAAMPLVMPTIAPEAHLILLVALTSLMFLALLGGRAVRAGSAQLVAGAVRVTFWGALAMAVTARRRLAVRNHCVSKACRWGRHLRCGGNYVLVTRTITWPPHLV
jgi:VIT1/CCC1 family predicted Fe2+/Mn2+ transporter